jgi:hypothetical protein
MLRNTRRKKGIRVLRDPLFSSSVPTIPAIPVSDIAGARDHMKPNTYQDNPALRPTVLMTAVKQTVYRPSVPAARQITPRDVPQVRQDATAPVARTTIRAA